MQMSIKYLMKPFVSVMSDRVGRGLVHAASDVNMPNILCCAGFRRRTHTHPGGKRGRGALVRERISCTSALWVSAEQHVAKLLRRQRGGSVLSKSTRQNGMCKLWGGLIRWY